MMETLEQTLAAYGAWLDRQPLAIKTRVAYRLWVHHYGTYLAQRPPTEDDTLRTPFALDYAVWNYKTYLKVERHAKPNSVNLALAAIYHFHQFIGNDRPQGQRESLPAQAPRTFKSDDQKGFLRNVERIPHSRYQSRSQRERSSAGCEWRVNAGKRHDDATVSSQWKTVGSNGDITDSILNLKEPQ